MCSSSLIVHTKSHFNYYMTDFTKIFAKMIDMRSAIKLAHQLSLEIYVNVAVHNKTNI